MREADIPKNCRTGGQSWLRLIPERRFQGQDAVNCTKLAPGVQDRHEIEHD